MLTIDWMGPIVAGCHLPYDTGFTDMKVTTNHEKRQGKEEQLEMLILYHNDTFVLHIVKRNLDIHNANSSVCTQY